MALSQMRGRRSRPLAQRNISLVEGTNTVTAAPGNAHPLIGLIATGINSSHSDIEDLKMLLGSTPYPMWLWGGRELNGTNWAEALMAFVNAAQNSGQPNAVVNLSLDLTPQETEGNRATCPEFTPMEMAALEYARQNQVLVVASTGHDENSMSTLVQAAQQFDHLLIVGATAATLSEADRVRAISELAVTATTIMAAAALVWATNAKLSYHQVINILITMVTDWGAATPAQATMMGVLNMSAAVPLAQASVEETAQPLQRSQPMTGNRQNHLRLLERVPHRRYELKAEDNLWAIAAREWGNVAVG